MADPDSTAPTAPRLSVVVTDGRGQAVRAPGLAAWLARVAPRAARGEVSVALVSDARIRALNKQFRRKDKPTDVLSFPNDAAGPPAFAASPLPPSRFALRRTSRRGRRTSRVGPRTSHLGPRFLGDIVISTMTARRQAREAGHSYAAELKRLALHGLLHLLGYDHDHPADRGRMARLERRLRASGGLRAGLIERQTPVTRRRGWGPGEH